MIDLEEIGLEVPNNIKWKISTLDQIKSQEKRSIISGPFGSNISSKFFTTTGVPVIRGNNLSNQIGIKFKDSGFVFISPEKANELNSWAIKDDLLFTAAGTIGQVGIITGNEKFKNYTISNKQLRVRLDRSIVNPYFAYYWFASPAIIDIIIQRDTGSTIPLINLGVLKSLPILLPSLPEQESIAEVLRSLDDKIDLLHLNNKTLEQLAETLYRQWFIEEADDSWEEVKLKSYIKTHSGYSYRSVDLNPSVKALVTLKSFNRNGGFRHDGFKEYTGKYKLDQVVKNGDLIVAHTDITQEAEVLGNPALVVESEKYDTLIISTDIVKVEPTSYLTKQYLYFLMKSDEFKHYCLGASNGTTVLHLSKSALPEYDFKLPPQNRIDEFTKIVEPVLSKISSNQRQVVQLESLRDTLLPKLMNGSVVVKK